jgi:hypothetical protein
MTQEEFQTKMTEATLHRCRANGPGDVAYYTGFMQGLLRSYHGVRFGTDAEHVLWLALTDDENLVRRTRGEGYRDGLRGEPRPEELS